MSEYVIRGERFDNDREFTARVDAQSPEEAEEQFVEEADGDFEVHQVDEAQP